MSLPTYHRPDLLGYPDDLYETASSITPKLYQGENFLAEAIHTSHMKSAMFQSQNVPASRATITTWRLQTLGSLTITAQPLPRHLRCGRRRGQS